MKGWRGGGEGERPDKRLKFGPGRHHLDVCGPPNSRKKQAWGRPDLFACVFSPSAFDALATLYVPHAVFLVSSEELLLL